MNFIGLLIETMNFLVERYEFTRQNRERPPEVSVVSDGRSVLVAMTVGADTCFPECCDELNNSRNYENVSTKEVLNEGY